MQSDEPFVAKCEKITNQIRDKMGQMKQETSRLDSHLANTLENECGTNSLLYLRELVRLIIKSYNEIFELKKKHNEIANSGGPFDENLE